MESIKTAFATLAGIGLIALMLAIQCMVAVVPIVIGLWLWKAIF